MPSQGIPAPPAVAVNQPASPIRFRIFVDFWNLQLTLNERHEEECARKREPHERFLIDWQKLPQCLVAEAAKLLNATSHSYEGTIVYTSYNPKNQKDKGFHRWATSWLDRQPGIQVEVYERRPTGPPKCPTCHREIATCPHSSCSQALNGSVEKGVDTAIATDMIRLAWEEAYDVAILATSDADLIPAVEFIDLKGRRVVQAGFPPHGAHLGRACWGTVDMYKCRTGYQKAP
jgi:uncharacterized LabA/DUF88 family protein